MIKNLDKYPIVTDPIYTKDDLSKFERLIDKELWTVRGLTKTEEFTRRILSKLF